MSFRLKLLTAVAATLLATAFAPAAHATEIALTGDGRWAEFTVDSSLSAAFDNGWIDFTDGSPLTFAFTVGADDGAVLTVVDAGFAGDTFFVTNLGLPLGTTSPVAVTDPSGPTLSDFDAALADPAFSRGVFMLGAGSYRIGGSLNQSVFPDGGFTSGAVRLTTVAAIPEPSTVALLAAGLGGTLLVARRLR